MPGRTWVIAPDKKSLSDRWNRLITENNADEKERLFHPHFRNGKPGDKHIRKALKEGLAGHEERLALVIEEKDKSVAATRYSYRSFDRQWIIPDARLINQQIRPCGITIRRSRFF